MLKKFKRSKEPPPYPDFLLIGAPQAGCDVIEHILTQDPNIWFPPLNNILAFHSSFQLGRLETAQRMFRKQMPIRKKNILWLLKYFFWPVPTMGWYGSLFRTKDKDLVRGEMSDEYITLPFDEVKQLHQSLPNAKVILMIRDPIERSLASIRYKFTGHPKMPYNKITKRQLVTLMNSDWARSHSGYMNALASWPIFFPPENLFIGFYDEMIAQPELFFARIYTFLEIEPPGLVTAQQLAPFLPRPEPALPAKLFLPLHAFYRLEIKALADRFGHYAADWKEKYQALEEEAHRIKREKAAAS